MIALVGELRQGRIQHPFLLVRGQVPKSREGRFFIHDQLVISNLPAELSSLSRVWPQFP